MTNCSIALQCIGLLLVVLLVCFTAGRRSLGLITEQAFRILLSMVALSICLDITSIITINLADAGTLSEGLNQFVCKSYIVSLTLVAFAVLFYALTEIYSGAILKQKRFLIYLVLEGAAILAVYILPLGYYLDEDSIYSFGMSTNVGAATGLFYLALSEVYLLVYRKITEPMRRRAIELFGFAMLFSASFQNFNRKYLIASLTIGICMIFIYMTLEDPNSYLDRLTGVPNQSVLRKYLKSTVTQGKQISIVNITLIGYRYLQDIYGDALYEKLTGELVSYFERYPKAKVFSSGGADFAVVFENLKDFHSHVEKIRKDFSRPWHVGNADVQLRVYVVEYPCDLMGTDPDEIFRTLRYFVNGISDRGEEDYLLVDPKRLKEKEEDDNMKRLLASSVTAGQLETWYQPICSVKDGKIFSVEAMARIRDEEGAVLLDDDVLPAAEKNGIILRIGMKVFEEVCLFIRDHDLEELGIRKIGVNLSAAQCSQRTLAEDMIEIMKNYGVDGSWFVFEITSNAVRYAREILMSNLNKLIAAGSEIAMDRFGKKGGSLIDVLELPIGLIKLDRSMIGKFFRKDTGEFTTEGEAVMSMLLRFDKVITAAGIETEAEERAMKKAGVDYMQGGYFFEPLSEKDLIEVCKKQNG